MAVTALVALSGCGAKTKYVAPAGSSSTATSASPGASPVLPASPGASSSPGSVVEFTVDGAGLYLLGAKLTDLQTTPGFASPPTTSTTCPQVTVAEGAGVWKGVHFSFHKDGVLYLAVNQSTTIPTPSGAWLGTTLAQLKTIYAGVQNEQLTVGTRSGFLVTTVDGHGVLFDLNAQGQVQSMTAGDAVYLRSSYQHGTTYC
jgi:hypothetical protein